MADAVFKPTFSVDQIVSATTAAKQFGLLRKRSKKGPLFILDHNSPDTVVLSYEAYENMYNELENLREQQFLLIAESRLKNHDPIPFESADDPEWVLDTSMEQISDEELFE